MNWFHILNNYAVINQPIKITQRIICKFMKLFIIDQITADTF